MDRWIRDSQWGREWSLQHLAVLLSVLVALIAVQPVGAATVTTPRDDTGSSTIVDGGVAWRPLVVENRRSSTAPTALQQTAAPTATAIITDTPTLTTAQTSITGTAVANQAAAAELTPANDAFAAWNSRAPVTRETAYPVLLQIPAIGVRAYVEQLGERADGSMATPTDPDNVAWYSYGAIPGENGNMVMAGHLDRAGGAPAVFWDLAALTIGDTVIVQDVGGTAYHYAVSDTASYPYTQAPLDQIFGFDLVSRLNLITCRGSWDRNRQTYTERLVVYTELVKIVEQ